MLERPSSSSGWRTTLNNDDDECNIKLYNNNHPTLERDYNMDRAYLIGNYDKLRKL